MNRLDQIVAIPRVDPCGPRAPALHLLVDTRSAFPIDLELVAHTRKCQRCGRYLKWLQLQRAAVQDIVDEEVVGLDDAAVVREEFSFLWSASLGAKLHGHVQGETGESLLDWMAWRRGILPQHDGTRNTGGTLAAWRTLEHRVRGLYAWGERVRGDEPRPAVTDLDAALRRQSEMALISVIDALSTPPLEPLLWARVVRAAESADPREIQLLVRKMISKAPPPDLGGWLDRFPAWRSQN